MLEILYYPIWDWSFSKWTSTEYGNIQSRIKE